MRLRSGFYAGIKSSGIPLAVLFSVATLWILRGRYRLIAGWILASTASFCLLGSIEIYINNAHLYGNPLGEPSFLLEHSNQDGLSGMVANTIRYVGGLINPGWQPCSHEPSWQHSLEVLCRDLLHFLGLTDKGYRPDFSDQKMQFLKIGFEAASDFGPLGTVAMIISTLPVLAFRKSQPAFWTAFIGWALLVINAATIAWMPWNMRFLMLPMILFVAAALMTLRPFTRKPCVFVGIVVFILYGATIYPLCSFNKQPVDMVNSLRNREAESLKERSSMQEVFDAVRNFHADSPATPWLLHAGSDSWVLGLLKMPDVNFTLAPQLETDTLNAAAAISPSDEVFILVLNRNWAPPEAALHVRQLIHFKWEEDSCIYSWRSSN